MFRGQRLCHQGELLLLGGEEQQVQGGQDDTYVTEAKTAICNKELRALCCPVSGGLTYLIILGFRFQEIK